MQENTITIFTDGSSRGNPGPGGYAYIAVYPDASGVFYVSEKGGNEKLTTNNRMEMKAVAEAFKFFDGYYSKEENTGKKYLVNIDSSYVLNGSTKWVFGWAKNGWKTSTKEDVLNVDLWKEIMEATAGKKIQWNLVKGHSGHVGNERCDEIATSYADALSGGDKLELFSGTLSSYSLNLFDASSNVSSSKSKSKNKGKAYSYVSAVDGLVMTHQTWEECEKRVKGANGAKYKKALSKSDEQNLIKILGNL